jgi:hypothetical protein
MLLACPLSRGSLPKTRFGQHDCERLRFSVPRRSSCHHHTLPQLEVSNSERHSRGTRPTVHALKLYCESGLEP